MKSFDKVSLFFVGLFIFWAAIIFAIALSSLPYNTISPRISNKLKIYSIMPEGFGYFTISPKTEDTYLFAKADSTWKFALIGCSSLDNILGLKRKSRAQGVELSIIVAQIQNVKWIDCETNITKMRWDTVKAIEVENKSFLHSICGEVLIQKRKPLPWAWYESRNEITMPSKVLKLYVKCK